MTDQAQVDADRLEELSKLLEGDKSTFEFSLDEIVSIASELLSLRARRNGEVTEDMVERAMKAFALIAHDMSSDEYDRDRAAAISMKAVRAVKKSKDAIRAALTAALSPETPDVERVPTRELFGGNMDAIIRDTDHQYAAWMASVTGKPVSTPAVDAEPVLPCDIKLPPATTIRAGCKLSTLHAALSARGMSTPSQATVTALRAERDEFKEAHSRAIAEATKQFSRAQDAERRATAAQAEAATLREQVEREPFQVRVDPWLMACFGREIASDKIERNHRFAEEALELVQAPECTESEAHQLVAYVFGRPKGETAQEVGGVMVTLAALCLAQGLDMHECRETELARIWTKVEKIRAKQAAKPKHSPLPEAPAALQDTAP